MKIIAWLAYAELAYVTWRIWQHSHAGAFLFAIAGTIAVLAEGRRHFARVRDGGTG